MEINCEPLIVCLTGQVFGTIRLKSGELLGPLLPRSSSSPNSHGLWTAESKLGLLLKSTGLVPHNLRQRCQNLRGIMLSRYRAIGDSVCQPSLAWCAHGIGCDGAFLNWLHCFESFRLVLSKEFTSLSSFHDSASTFNQCPHKKKILFHFFQQQKTFIPEIT